MRILPMSEEDIGEIEAAERGTAGGWSRQLIEDELRLPCNWQFILRSDGRLIGYVLGQTVAGETEIRKLHVLAPFRRQGHASRLLEHALALAAMRRHGGGTSCHLELRATNQPAANLYCRFGFVETGRRKNYYTAPTEDAILMVRPFVPGNGPVGSARAGDPIHHHQKEAFVKNIRDLDIREKRLLMRVDFNVPQDDQGAITEDSRIREVVPTLRYALEQKARIVLMSHCGRPKGERNPKYSMAPAAKRLSELLGRPVTMAEDCVGGQAKAKVDALRPGEVLMLENLRFHAGETKNDPEFSRQLAEFADAYVNDAFAVSHRAHASVEGVTHFVDQCAAGFLLQKEIDYFHRSVSDPVRPLAAVIGGAKVSSKLGAIDNLLEKVDIMVIGGAMANTFLKSQGVNVGKSLVEDDLLETAATFISKARAKGVKFYLPVDCVAAEALAVGAPTAISTIQDVPATWMILDIGPASSRLFAEAIAPAKTIIWNGPLGAFEIDAFSRGSLAMVESFTSAHALTIVGGGDTNALIAKAGAEQQVSYMSTGGGAFLELMEGKELPGVAALKAKA